jgi:hypothetical protein
VTDTVLKVKGMETLTRELGIVEAERFIALMLSEPFDYTEWQRDLYQGVSLDDFCRDVKTFRERNI